MRLLFLAALAALALLPTSAVAQTLWRNVEAGMSAGAVSGLFPRGQPVGNGAGRRLENVERFGTCTAHVVISMPDRAVSQVTIFSQWFDAIGGMALDLNECGDDAQAALTRRHGQPDSSRNGTNGLGERFRADRWTRDGVEIEFSRYGTASGDKWSITYRPTPGSAGANAAGPSTARPVDAPPAPVRRPLDHFRELKLSLEAVRIRGGSGAVQSYALSGAPCAPVLTQTWIGGEPGPEAELVLTNATARTRIDDGRYHVVEISWPDQEPFDFSVDTAARGTQAVAALNALIRACAG